VRETHGRWTARQITGRTPCRATSAIGRQPLGVIYKATGAAHLDEITVPDDQPGPPERSDGCGRVTPHSSNQRIYTLRVAEREVSAPPEAVCDECRHAQPRTVGDEIPADVTVVCAGHPFRRFGSKRSRRTCGRGFAVPGAASSVLCPWCATC
jgi:hypothetical protein